MNSLMEESRYPGTSQKVSVVESFQRNSSSQRKLDEDSLSLHQIARTPEEELRMSQVSPTSGQMHSPSSNASSVNSEASKMTDKQMKRVQRLQALFPGVDGGMEGQDFIFDRSQTNVERVEQQLAMRERDLVQREKDLQRQQAEVRKQVQDLRWQLERRSGELASQKQRVATLVQSKVELQTQLESVRQQMNKQQQEFEAALHGIRRSPTIISHKSKSPTPSFHSLTSYDDVMGSSGELEGEVQRLKNEVASLNVLKGQLSQREQQVMDLRRALNSKEEELRELKEAGGTDTSSLQQRIGELENALQLQTEESGSLRQQLASLRNNRQEFESQLELVKIKSAQVKAQLKMDGGEGGSGGDGVSSVIDDMEKELERLRDRLSSADSQVDDLTNELRHKDHEMADAHAQLVSLRKNVLTMNNQVVAYGSENKELQDKLRAKAAAAEIALSQASRATRETERLREQNEELAALSKKAAQEMEAMRLGYVTCLAISVSKIYNLQNKIITCNKSKICIQQKVTEVACDMFDIQRCLGLRPTSLCVQGVPCLPGTEVPKGDRETTQKYQQLQEIGQELKRCQNVLYDNPKMRRLSNSMLDDDVEATSIQARAIEAISVHRMGSHRRLVKLLRGRNPWIVWLRRVIVTSAVLLLKKRHQISAH